RRRHTRWPRDWSSDVCSSDLRSPKLSRAAHRVEILPTRTVSATSHRLAMHRCGCIDGAAADPQVTRLPWDQVVPTTALRATVERSEERRVGKEGRTRVARET